MKQWEQRSRPRYKTPGFQVRTKDGADTFVTIMSYLGTANKQGINAYLVIKSALINKSQDLIFSKATEQLLIFY